MSGKPYIEYNVKVTGVEELANALKGVEKHIARNIATAINETKKKAVTLAARELGEIVPIPIKILKKLLSTKSKATENKTYARFSMMKGYPISLRYFNAKRAYGAVTYRRSKLDKGRMIALGAFIIRKGGKVYRRVGLERGPLKEVFGPSPGQFFSEGIEAKVLALIQDQLPLRVKEKIRVILLRQAGIIKPKKGMH